jgi:hypothetical protein
MKPQFVKLAGMALATAALSISLALAGPYENGQSVESFQAKDQYETAFTFKPADTRYLLVSHDMDTGKKANAALSPRGKEFLGSKKAVYMANIFGMPGIGRMFAMPKMKKYNHRIILADDAALIARFPAQAGKVTVLTLNGGKVGAINYWAPGTESVDTYLK